VNVARFPRVWSLGVIGPKCFLVLFFLAMTWILISGGKPGGFVAAVPMIAAVVYFFHTGQLRSDGVQIGYRKWCRWQTLPLDEIEEIRRVWIVGSVKLSGHSKKLRFFVERENEHLLGFRAETESLRDRLNPPPVRPLHPALLALLGAAGFAFGILIPVPHPSAPMQGPDWIIGYSNFLNRHSILLGVLVLIGLAWQLRYKTLRNSERGICAFVSGAVFASLLRGL
jgi:hypothetical protein